MNHNFAVGPPPRAPEGSSWLPAVEFRFLGLVLVRFLLLFLFLSLFLLLILPLLLSVRLTAARHLLRPPGSRPNDQWAPLGPQGLKRPADRLEPARAGPTDE